MTILIVDDEKNIRAHLSTFVAGLGHEVQAAASVDEAIGLLTRRSFEIVLSDVRMAQHDGLALLREVRARWPDTIVVLMTAYATVAQAVEAMRGGAYDYIVKPFALEQIRLLLDRIAELRRLRHENETLRHAVAQPALLESRSAAMMRVLDTARQVAPSEATVLLTGESGTGKNVLAAAIHGWSARASGPFVTIPCTTLTEHLLESELFGHVKGAFTGAWKDKPGRLEAAQGGTVFLDEVGELPAVLQAKLLRFIEEHAMERVGGDHTIRVDARIVAATNRDLEGEVEAGRFRRDLFFRLNVIAIRLPPLRERREDLPALTDHILTSLSMRHRRTRPLLDETVRRTLASYSWPGNVRELVNALEHALVLSRADALSVSDLPDRLLAPTGENTAAPVASELSLDEMERRHIQQVLTDSTTLEEAAARLGINATTLWRKRKRYRID